MNRNIPAWIVVLVAAFLVYAVVSITNNAQTERATDATVTQIQQSYR